MNRLYDKAQELASRVRQTPFADNATRDAICELADLAEELAACVDDITKALAAAAKK